MVINDTLYLNMKLNISNISFNYYIISLIKIKLNIFL